MIFIICAVIIFIASLFGYKAGGNIVLTWLVILDALGLGIVTMRRTRGKNKNKKGDK